MKYSVAQKVDFLGEVRFKDLKIIEASSIDEAAKIYSEAYDKAFPNSPMKGQLNLEISVYKL